MKFLALFALVFSTNCLAAELNCSISENGTQIEKVQVTSTVGEKTKVTAVADATVYVTERKDQLYTIEAFLPSYEMRIYGEGNLRSKADRVTASLWNRDVILDFSCSL